MRNALCCRNDVQVGRQSTLSLPTSDYGKTWKKITNGIPDTAFTRVIREDPNKRGLLYAGTETGMYVSFDNGERWQSLQLNLPIVPITDLDSETRKRVGCCNSGTFVLDPRRLAGAASTDGRRWFSAAGETRLFKPKESYRMPAVAVAPLGRQQPSAETANGVVVYYSLKEKPTSEVELEFLDPAGKSIQKVHRSRAQGDAPPLAASRRVLVVLRRQCADGCWAQSVCLGHAICGCSALSRNDLGGGNSWSKDCAGNLPGKTHGRRQKLNSELRDQSRSACEYNAADYAKQVELGLKIRDKLTETHNAIIQIREVRRQVEDLLKRDGSTEFQSRERCRNGVE